MPPLPPTPTNLKKTRAGKLRRTLGWTLLTLGLLVAGVWVASRWVWSRFSIRTADITCRRGLLIVGSCAPSGIELEAEWMSPTSRGWDFWFENDPNFDTNLGMYVMTDYPEGRRDHLFFWPIPLLLWTPAALLLRSGILARRRAITGLCKKCGYSLAGLPPAPDATCPECGKRS